VPDPLSIIRLAALLIFIGLVALGLWLLDVAWWVVPPVMALALLIAWTIEWLAWREGNGKPISPATLQTAVDKLSLETMGVGVIAVTRISLPSGLSFRLSTNFIEILALVWP
jgi:hypothetical protein